MRTTVTLADDVAAAVARLQRDQGIGVSEALNRLARAGLMDKRDRPRFVQRTADLGRQKLDVTNIGDVLEVLDGPAHR
jgi:hypothetical protein